MNRYVAVLLLAVSLASAQPNLSGAAQTRLSIERLGVLGSVLMIGAHPDDEHTPTLAYFARGRLIRTGYVSVTRGEGGQNLLGSEQGDLLGLIRTEELLAARSIDGAEQYFTRAVDFGFTKSAQETLGKWGREAILSDLVWTIRNFRPDVIILCFSGTARDGHGQHQASSILGKEAFFAAADPKRFPEQLKWVAPWKAKRVVWNVYGSAPDVSGRVTIQTGDYNPVLGHSYAEIAGMSRSMHGSQGMGSPERRGRMTANLVPIAGDPASRDLFDGVDTTWNRVSGGAETGRILASAAKSFNSEHPTDAIPALLEARKQIAALKDPWAARKLDEIDETIALCTGLWLDASADRYQAVPGQDVSVRVTALNRSNTAVRLESVTLDQPVAINANLPYNEPNTKDVTWKVPASAAYSQPYWLREPHGDTYTVRDQQLEGTAENPPVISARFRLRVGDQRLELTRPVVHRYVDRTRGELTRPFIIVPPVALRFSQPVLVAPNLERRRVEVTVRSNIKGANGKVRLEAPDGWRASPESRGYELAEPGEEAVVAFDLTPPAPEGRWKVRAVTTVGGVEIASGMDAVAYPHIHPQVVFPPSTAALVRSDIQILAKKIGYIMGAGDDVPDSLRQLGCDVTLLTSDNLASGDLAVYDAIVTGVRAFNVRADLRASFNRLLNYAKNGGTLVVQYNVVDYGPRTPVLDRIGPYPLTTGRDRVSVEDAPVTLPDPASPLLTKPNRITAADFDGWVQERGLYFASEWDSQYKTLIESHDPGEARHPGGTLYTRYGKGAYVFTAYSWFRQLPAGVPGAYRIFANLLSAGKVLP